MSFLQNIKFELSERSRQGRNKVLIERHDLKELVYHFERLDEQVRNDYENRLPHNQNLIRKHGICLQCGDFYSHHLNEPFASCKCGCTEWSGKFTSFMELEYKLLEAQNQVKDLERWLEQLKKKPNVEFR